MAGFFPLGSSPVASTPTTDLGDIYTFGQPGAIIFGVPSGSELVVSGINALWTHTTIRETLRSAGSGSTGVQTFELVRETLRSAGTGATEIDIFVAVRETLRSLALESGRRRMSLM